MINVCMWPVIIYGFGICYLLNDKCLYVWPVIIYGFGICYTSNVCVASYLSSRHLDYPLWDVLYLRLKKCTKQNYYK